jgi:uncharacterized membrane protein YuzA (DUF378 family)
MKTVKIFEVKFSYFELTKLIAWIIGIADLIFWVCFGFCFVLASPKNTGDFLPWAEKVWNHPLSIIGIACLIYSVATFISYEEKKKRKDYTCHPLTK